MQRKDIDKVQFEDLQGALDGATISPGAITFVMGYHPMFGALILTSTDDNFAVLGNDVRLLVGRDESLETEMAAVA